MMMDEAAIPPTQTTGSLQLRAAPHACRRNGSLVASTACGGV